MPLIRAWSGLAPQLAFVGRIHDASDGALEDFGEHLIVLQSAIDSVFAWAVHLFRILFITVLIQDLAPYLSQSNIKTELELWAWSELDARYRLWGL